MDLDVHRHAERRHIGRCDAFAPQTCPQIADVDFHIEIGRPIAGRHEGTRALQRALMRAGCAHVERYLSVIHPQVAVEVLD